MAPTRDLFAELDAAPAMPEPAGLQALPPPEPAPCGAVFQAPAPRAPEDGTPLPAAEPRIRYAEAERLMAIGRAQGPDALTPEQHHAI